MFDLSKLDVCFIAGTLGQGGAERQLFYIIRTLRQSGARVWLLCLTQGEFWESRLAGLGVEITWVGQSGSRGMRLINIVKALKKDRPHILHSQHFYTNLYAVAAARLLRMREVGAMRSDGISEVRANGRILGQLSLLLPRIVAANSRAAIRNAITLGAPATRLRFLPNVVDTEQFKPANCRVDGPVRLLAVGRLEEQKRMDRYLSVLASLRGKLHADIRGAIVGDGPKRVELEALAVQLGLLPGIVEFVGTVGDMRSVYRKADILVVTSDREGTPNVTLEAMASSLPVVSTRVGGVPEVVSHGETGYLCDAGDEQAMADRLLELINNRDLRQEMGRRARRYVVSNHSPAGLPGWLEELYEAALG